MRIPFKDRYEEMGLEGMISKGFYKYSDQYAEVVYRQVITMDCEENAIRDYTDSQILPLIAIFTKHPVDEHDYTYCGVVSELYQFMGYDVLNKKIRDSINEIGNANIVENPIIKYDKTFLRNEFIIQSSQQTISEVGDVFPVIITENSYNGSRAATLSFGLATHSRSNSIVFKFDLGKICTACRDFSFFHQKRADLVHVLRRVDNTRVGKQQAFAHVCAPAVLDLSPL